MTYWQDSQDLNITVFKVVCFLPSSLALWCQIVGKYFPRIILRMPLIKIRSQYPSENDVTIIILFFGLAGRRDRWRRGVGGTTRQPYISHIWYSFKQSHTLYKYSTASRTYSVVRGNSSEYVQRLHYVVHVKSRFRKQLRIARIYWGYKQFLWKYWGDLLQEDKEMQRTHRHDCWTMINLGPETGRIGRWRRAECHLGTPTYCGSYLRYGTLASGGYCLSLTGARYARRAVW